MTYHPARHGPPTGPGDAAWRRARSVLAPVLLALATLVAGCGGAGAPDPEKRGPAVRALDDVRRVVTTCSRYVAWGATVSFTIRDTDLGPADGLLVRGRIEAPGVPERITLFLTVRRGDLLSTLNAPGPMEDRRVYETAEKLVDLLG